MSWATWEKKEKLLGQINKDKISGLSALATDPPGQLDVLRHDGDTLGVDGAQVRVLEEADQVSLACLLNNQKKSVNEQEMLELEEGTFFC